MLPSLSSPAGDGAADNESRQEDPCEHCGSGPGPLVSCHDGEHRDECARRHDANDALGHARITDHRANLPTHNASSSCRARRDRGGWIRGSCSERVGQSLCLDEITTEVNEDRGRMPLQSRPPVGAF